MEKIKSIALVAHDHQKKDLIDWVRWNHEILLKHKLICTGTTGRMVETAINEMLHDRELKHHVKKVQLTRLKSGPLGGDQQLGAMISEGKVDVIIFFWDPMEPVPHDVDVKALLRIAVVYNIPTACNRSSADFLISSPLMAEPYDPRLVDYSAYINRSI